jgi:RNA polymerase sigma-70 factor (ECF subfamily)
MSSNPSSHHPGAAAAQFPTTRWSQILLAADPEAPQARESIASLCDAYWYPLYAYIRRRGHSPDAACDLTQDLFTRILERRLFAEADPARGRFRSFLRTVCIHFLANRHDWNHAARRGGGKPLLSIDSNDAETRYACEPADTLSPDRIFERTWALTLLGRVLQQLGRDYDEAGKAPIFDALRNHLDGHPDTTSYAAVAEQLGMTEGAVRVAAHRLRQEIASTLAEPSQVDDEIQALFAALDA